MDTVAFNRLSQTTMEIIAFRQMSQIAVAPPIFIGWNGAPFGPARRAEFIEQVTSVIIIHPDRVSYTLLEKLNRPVAFINSQQPFPQPLNEPVGEGFRETHEAVLLELNFDGKRLSMAVTMYIVELSFSSGPFNSRLAAF